MNKVIGTLLVIPSSQIQEQVKDSLNGQCWYIIGMVIAVVFIVYLAYALIKPEKF